MKYLKHLIVLLFIKLPVQLAGAVILAIYLPFHDWVRPKSVSITHNETLPKILRWFDNAGVYENGGVFEEYKTDGLSGGPSYRALWKKPEGVLARYTWLAWRNAVNYFQMFTLGYPAGQDAKVVYNVNTAQKTYILLTNGAWELDYTLHFYLYYSIRIGYKLIHDDGIACVSSKNPAQWVFDLRIRTKV
jgi:hypothetical protein